MAINIQVFAGRLKSVIVKWYQGSNSSGPSLDLTGATFTVLRSSTLSPTPSIVDAVNGVCQLDFPAQLTLGKSGIYQVWMAVTLPSNPGFSPDPALLMVSIT